MCDSLAWLSAFFYGAMFGGISVMGIVLILIKAIGMKGKSHEQD
jgi:hypothetical protein